MLITGIILSSILQWLLCPSTLRVSPQRSLSGGGGVLRTLGVTSKALGQLDSDSRQVPPMRSSKPELGRLWLCSRSNAAEVLGE